MTLNCFIVDDEPLATKLLQGFVERTPFLHLSGLFLDPMEALSALTPDIQLLFLDIQMPGVTGLELSRLVPPATRIIFTTAYREYAFESYEVQALDYLLKPISYPAFLKAATRAKNSLSPLPPSPVGRGSNDTLTNTIISPLPTGLLSPDKRGSQEGVGQGERLYIFVKVDYKLVRVDLDSILYISGLKDYVRIYQTGGQRPLTVLSTMKALEEKLPKSRFFRVHRSYIVALGKIESLEHNRIRIAGELIPVSESCIEELMKRLT